MRSLFLKIFLWFGLAVLLISLPLALTFLIGESEFSDQHDKTMDSTFTPLLAQRAAELYEEHGAVAVSLYLSELKNSLPMHKAYFFAEDGKVLAGADVPAAATEMLPKARLADIIQVTSIPNGNRLVAQRTSGPSGSRYVFVAEVFTPGPKNFLQDRPEIQALRFFFVILVAALVCYWLARYITRPIKELRIAAGKLASGNLAARVGVETVKRNDELGDLSRDFDHMAEQVESLIASQRRLTSDISHELRSPLARVSVALGLARRHATPEVTRALDRIERETERLNDMIGSLLKIARLESGVELENYEPIDLAAIIKEVAYDADFEARSRDRRVQVRKASTCQVNGNWELLRSAVENVVRNAVNHTAAGTEVEIFLNCEYGGKVPGYNGSSRDYAVVRVQDRGPGVPDDQLTSIFRPFYRVGDARERAAGGTGLGLAITERAVHIHKGQVSAQNRPDGGLSIELRFPLAAGANLPAEHVMVNDRSS